MDQQQQETSVPSKSASWCLPQDVKSCHQLLQESLHRNRALGEECKGLRQRCDKLEEECSHKDGLLEEIETLKQRFGIGLGGLGLNLGNNLENIGKKLAANNTAEEPTQSRPASPAPTDAIPPPPEPEDFFDVQSAVRKLEHWLFNHGSHLPNIQEFLSQYCEFVRNEMAIPLDRLFIGAFSLHPRVSRYVWKWEVGTELAEHEIPNNIFDKMKEKLKGSPFVLLQDGLAERVRMRASDEEILNDCEWFRKENYTDYLALPITRSQQFLGALAWSTKNTTGFSPYHLQLFEESMAALNSTLRVHFHAFVLNLLRSALQIEVEQRTKDLADANHRLQQQSALQLQHFAMMSHEIRTPLNCIIGLSSMMEVDPSQQESLNMIVRSGALLLSVVNDVLDYSRLESGFVDICEEPTCPSDVTNLVVHSMSAKARERSIQIETKLPENMPTSILTDGSRLQQILYNLLGNAVKFSPEGSCVDFEVSIVHKPAQDKASANQPIIQFSVKDVGKGISESNRATIFEPFNQGSKGTARSYGGTGLGLAITSKLVKALNGSISVDSVEGEWTEFVVELPCNECSNFNPQSDENTSTDPPAVVERVRAYECTKKTLSSQSGSSQSNIITDTEDRDPSSRKQEESETTRSTGIADPEKGLSSPAQDRSKPLMQLEPSSKSQAQPIPPNVAISTIKTPSQNEKLSASRNATSVIGKDMKILVVDDNRINVKMLVKMLQRLGATDIDTAANGLEACNLEAEKNYSLVLMDMEMPIMDGLEATRRILSRSRTREEGHPPKIIFVTAHALESYRNQAAEAGGSGFLTKPFDLKKLTKIFVSDEAACAAKSVMVCDSDMHCSSSTIKTPPQNEKPNASRNTTSVIGKDTKILVVDDNRINVKMLVKMLQRLGAKDVDTAANGLEACNLEAEKNYSLVLMDMEMPIMDGLEATRRILSRARTREEGHPPKIIFVTAHALESYRNQAAEAGGSGFLTKPFDLKKLTKIFVSDEAACAAKSVMYYFPNDAKPCVEWSWIS